MISDVLHEAVAEIEEYQRSFLKSYDGLRGEIGAVTAVMNALRAWLDCPPIKGRYPRFEAVLGRLRAELANLDVEPLRRAMNDFKAAWPTLEEIEEANRQPGPPPSTNQDRNEEEDAGAA